MKSFAHGRLLAWPAPCAQPCPRVLWVHGDTLHLFLLNSL